MPEAVERGDGIARNPDIADGAPVVDGTRTRVIDVAIAFEYNRMSPDEIVEHYPQLDLSDVHAALAYYYDHIEEMKEALRRKDEFGA